MNEMEKSGELMRLLAKNDIHAWEYVYDKYSSILYGTILRITSNEKFGEEILTRTFLTYKVQGLFPTADMLFISILRHTVLTSLNYMQSIGVKPREQNNLSSHFPLLDKILYLPGDRDVILLGSGLSAEELRKQLKNEMKLLRSINSHK